MAGAAAPSAAAATRQEEGERTPPMTSPSQTAALVTTTAPAAHPEEQAVVPVAVAAGGDGDDGAPAASLMAGRPNSQPDGATEAELQGLVHEISQSYPPGHHRDPSADSASEAPTTTITTPPPLPPTPTTAPAPSPPLIESALLVPPPPSTPGLKRKEESWAAYLLAWLWWGWRWAYEYVCEIAWDLVYVGYWILTPFVGGLPPVREGKPGKAPVVIVPGFCGRPRPFTRMRDRIAALGHPVWVFESGWQWGSIVDKSLQLSQLLAAEGLTDVIVVGHSMGGLVAAEAMIRGEPRIKRLIAVGVPFHGSYFALTALFLILWLLSKIESTGLAVGLLMALLTVPSTRQMLPGSDLLCTLRPRYPEIAHKVTCIYAPFDNILLLGDSALLLPDSQYFRAADLTATAAALAPAAPQQAAVAAAPTTDKPIPTAPAKSRNGEKGNASANGHGKHGRKESTNGRTVVCDRFGHAHLLFGDGAHDLIVGELLGEDGVVMGFGESM